MPRIEYRPDDDLGPPSLVAAIRSRRGGALLKMDRVMLHSPVFAAAWNDFLRVVIGDLSLPERESQFVMCIVGILNGADYEVFSHAPRFLSAGGTEEQLQALEDIDAAIRNEAVFTLRERAILKMTVEMTQSIAVDEHCFEQARHVLKDEKEMVDLIGLIATYNMVSRFVVALDIRADDGSL